MKKLIKKIIKDPNLDDQKLLDKVSEPLRGSTPGNILKGLVFDLGIGAFDKSTPFSMSVGELIANTAATLNLCPDEWMSILKKLDLNPENSTEKQSLIWQFLKKNKVLNLSSAQIVELIEHHNLNAMIGGSNLIEKILQNNSSLKLDSNQLFKILKEVKINTYFPDKGCTLLMTVLEKYQSEKLNLSKEQLTKIILKCDWESNDINNKNFNGKNEFNNIVLLISSKNKFLQEPFSLEEFAEILESSSLSHEKKREGLFVFSLINIKQIKQENNEVIFKKYEMIQNLDHYLIKTSSCWAKDDMDNFKSVLEEVHFLSFTKIKNRKQKIML